MCRKNKLLRNAKAAAANETLKNMLGDKNIGALSALLISEYRKGSVVAIAHPTIGDIPTLSR